MVDLRPQYRNGTYRLRPPEQTLDMIKPHFAAMDITRIADLSQLDMDLGVPTYAAVRPTGVMFQSSHGKGLTRASAKVSAAMEAIELHHAENPQPEALVHASAAQLARQGRALLRPSALCSQVPRPCDHPNLQLEWTRARCLQQQREVWIPAGAAYFLARPVIPASSNGLASGNHLVEASLHALYELLERDAISQLNSGGQLRLDRGAQVVDPKSVALEALQSIQHKIEAADSQLVLIWVPTRVQVHTFWAVLLNNMAMSKVSSFNVGYGTHARMEIAAIRAVSEAIQSRVTMIHAAREDILEMPVRQRGGRDRKAFNFFAALRPNITWPQLQGKATLPSEDLAQTLDLLLVQLRDKGFDQVLQVDLTQKTFQIPVVKLLVPGLAFDHRLF